MVLRCILLTSAHTLTFNKKFWEELIAYFPRYDTGHIDNDESNSSSIVACVFVTAVTLLSNDRGIFTEPLPSNDKGYAYRNTD
jgi:hypothetical protein